MRNYQEAQFIIILTNYNFPQLIYELVLIINVKKNNNLILVTQTYFLEIYVPK